MKIGFDDTLYSKWVNWNCFLIILIRNWVKFYEQRCVWMRTFWPKCDQQTDQLKINDRDHPLLASLIVLLNFGRLWPCPAYECVGCTKQATEAGQTVQHSCCCFCGEQEGPVLPHHVGVMTTLKTPKLGVAYWPVEACLDVMTLIGMTSFVRFDAHFDCNAYSQLAVKIHLLQLNGQVRSKRNTTRQYLTTNDNIREDHRQHRCFCQINPFIKSNINQFSFKLINEIYFWQTPTLCAWHLPMRTLLRSSLSETSAL